MPMKISMAISEENGSPEMESFVAHCTLEFDDEPSTLQDTEALQHNIHTAIAVCCRTVHEELRRQRPAHRSVICPSRSANSIRAEP